jgi:RNA polymerase sigma factor (sigma-70 family)
VKPHDPPKAPESASPEEPVGVLDPAAEDHLARTFGRRIYVMALARTRDPDAAHDLSQSALIEILMALRKGQLRDPQKLRGFVLGTTRNVINYYLRARIHAPRSEPLGADTRGAEGAQIRDLERAERLALMSRAVARLEPGDQQILRMTLIQGWDPTEIAARLGLSSEVVRQRKSRAVKRVIEVVKSLSRNQGGTPLSTDAETDGV